MKINISYIKIIILYENKYYVIYLFLTETDLCEGK